MELLRLEMSSCRVTKKKSIALTINMLGTINVRNLAAHLSECQQKALESLTNGRKIHLPVDRKEHQDPLPLVQFLYRLQPWGLWNTLHHRHLSEQNPAPHNQFSNGISKITTAQLLKTCLYLLGYFCFPPTYLKILFIHSEERVWTHCLYVKLSGHIGATNSSIDAFSCHPHLRFMAQLKNVHQMPLWPLQKHAPWPNYPPCQLSGASHRELSATNILRSDPPPGSSDNREALSQDPWRRSSTWDLFESPQSS